jgi:hypothetical protein
MPCSLFLQIIHNDIFFLESASLIGLLLYSIWSRLSLKALFFFFFLMPFPFFAIRLFGRRFFLSNSFLPILSFLQVVRRGSGALSPATHAHSTSHSQTYQHLYTHGRLFPTGLEPVLTSRWWSKECRSSFHHPTVSP